MYYLLKCWCSSATRGHNDPQAVGGVAVWFPNLIPGTDRGRYFRGLPPTPATPVTPKRAAVEAIFLALEVAQHINRTLPGAQRMILTVHTDSDWVEDAMHELMDYWIENHWINPDGSKAPDRDLLIEADQMRMGIEDRGGNVVFTKVSPESNTVKLAA
ncbi:hypothetical protein B0H10DRAFT_713919 [Mycena sp. CBHHK59/15]|nr:hypothetical protein B0H10DRAFT_713919 [Mycena sp. CBHHK59/15]